mmetsp:Transcript_28395/g.91542  ORF Transcript_28395/g.91542 Transcript_28395/m.91542 type:complete len:189 (+) Transcript_28395:74-640(+)
MRWSSCGVWLLAMSLLDSTDGFGYMEEKVMDEMTLGDFGEPTSPTQLGALMCPTVVKGKVGTAMDRGDSMSFVVPMGKMFTGLVLTTFKPTAGETLIYLNEGAVSFLPEEAAIPMMLGSLMLTEADEGSDLLAKMSASTLTNTAPPQGTGFATPLPAGEYTLTFWASSSSQEAVDYELEIDVMMMRGA